MKKLLVVLTILVLAAGFAFADISGSVAAEYTIGGLRFADDSLVKAGYTTPGTRTIDAFIGLGCWC